MTEPRHHISDETLTAYAAGSLDRALSVVVASHLTMCPSCRSRQDRLEEIGGLLLDDLDPAEIAPEGLDLILAQLDDDDLDMPETASAQMVLRSDAIEVPKPLRDLLPDTLDNVQWRGFAPGIKQYRIDGFDGRSGTLCLLKIAPGKTIPPHTHQGAELTLILRGSFSDDLGRFQRGDIADLDSDITHQPIADTSEPCVCLIATEGPLRFKGLLPRLLQPILGM